MVNIVGAPAKATTSEMTTEAETRGTLWMSTLAGPPELDSRKVSNSREDSNIQLGHQQQQELKTWTFATSARENRNITDVNSRRGRHATVGMTEIVEKRCQQQYNDHISRNANSTVWTPTAHEFSQKFARKLSERRKIHAERQDSIKREKNSPFLAWFTVFSWSDSYQNIGILSEVPTTRNKYL
jgi:hypothetical protein